LSDIAGIPSQNVRQQPGQPRLDGAQTTRALGAEFRNGTLVTGVVLGMSKNGGYLVQVQDALSGYSQKLTARATLPLIIGQNFRAIWDNSGEIPILRLSEDDFALLSKFGEGMEREVATALLARGMPVTSELINLVRIAWRLSGEKAEAISSILELWARDLPMTAANVQIISWYLALERKNISRMWREVQLSFKERVNKGASPIDALKSLLEGEDDVAMFLKGHSMLSKPLKYGTDASSMGASVWPVGDNENPLFARIWVSSDHSANEGARSWQQVSFEMEGNVIDVVSGEVESDSVSYVVGLRTENESTFQLLRFIRGTLRRELDDIPMPLQYIGVNLGKRTFRTANRSLDIKV